MRYHRRRISSRLEKAFATFPVVVVVGARQVGKSTLLNHLFGKQARSVVFDPLQDVEGARQDPELFIRSNKTPLILDEIQYAPEVVPAIKRAVDRHRDPGQFLITGSQQWEVMKSLAESLAGRAVIFDLEGFSLAEISNEWKELGAGWLSIFLNEPEEILKLKRLPTSRSVYEQIWRGWLPDAQNLDLSLVSDFHESYLRTYIERDARLLGNVSDWRQFRRFYQLVSALTAQEINYSELGRDIGIAPNTAKSWLEILQATFQWQELFPFSNNTLKRVSKKPKGHCADTGLVCAACLVSSPQALAGNPIWGSLFESAVYSEIRKQCSLMSPSPRLYHWRSHGGAEVDIIVELDNKYFPIEVKSKTNPEKRDIKGVLSFRETYPNLDITPAMLVCLADRSYKIHESAFVVPWDLCDK